MSSQPQIRITYNADGIPAHVIMDGGSVVVSGQKNPGKATPYNPAGEVPPAWVEEIGKLLWVNWGDDNNLPRNVINEIRKNGVASQAVRLQVQTLYGQSIIPVRVTDIDPYTGKETLEYVRDTEIHSFLKRSNINSLRAKSLLDYVTLGNVFPLLCLNQDRSEIVMVDHDKAEKFRYAPYDSNLERIPGVWRSANWPNPDENQREMVPTIDASHWFYEVDRIKADDQHKYCYPINCLDVLNDYYAVATWMGIYTNGTLENSNAIPQIMKSMIKNIWSLKYHVEISADYWKFMYPNFEKMDKKDRDAIVNGLYTQMNDFLSGSDNQMKSFISTFTIDRTTGKPIPGIIINQLDDKDKLDKWNPNTTVFDAEILFAFGVNPAMFGLGSPGGAHTGGSNNGGSNIRESWLTMIAKNQMDRDLNYQWFDFVCAFNGWPDDIELRTIDKVLTTLDSGGGTKTLS